MKTADIEIGQDYAYSRARQPLVFPDRVTVLAKGVDYGQAKGRGAEVDTEGQGVRLVLSSGLRCTWAEWEVRLAQREAEEKLANAAKERRQALADRFGTVLRGLGVESRTREFGVGVAIILDERAAKGLLQLLDA